MAKRPHDDLFSETTMTFGEHLEELRVVLFRAIIGLFIGCVVGLLLANHVVRWIEVPLKKALLEYHLKFDIRRLAESTEGALPDGIEGFMRKYALTYDDVYVEPSEITRLSELWSGLKEPASAETEDKFNADTASEFMTAQLPVPTRLPLKTRVWRPLRTRVTSLSAHEAFMIWLKAGFVSGLIVASPWIFLANLDVCGGRPVSP